MLTILKVSTYHSYSSAFVCGITLFRIAICKENLLFSFLLLFKSINRWQTASGLQTSRITLKNLNLIILVLLMGKQFFYFFNVITLKKLMKSKNDFFRVTQSSMNVTVALYQRPLKTFKERKDGGYDEKVENNRKALDLSEV